MAFKAGSATRGDDSPLLFVFDVGGVLIGLDRAARDSRLGTSPDLSPDETLRLQHANRLFRLGQMSEANYVIVLSDIHAVEPETLYAAENAFLIAGDPDMADLLARLRISHRVIAFSNTNAIHWRQVSSALLADEAFHACYLSHEMGMEKPDRKSYETVAAREDVPPENIVFIDDTLSNIEAARAIGWENVIHHRSASETIAAVEAILAQHAVKHSRRPKLSAGME